jgi:hypothetical protein
MDDNRDEDDQGVNGGKEDHSDAGFQMVNKKKKRKEQRDIKFEDIEDAQDKGTVSLAIHFKEEDGMGQATNEISKWVEEIEKQSQFRGIRIGEASAKGRDGDRRMQVELQGSKEHVRELIKCLKSTEHFRVQNRRVIYTQDRQQQPVVVVEGQLASQEVGFVALFYRNEEGEEVDVENIALCSQCSIVIDRNSTDAKCCSFRHTWWPSLINAVPRANFAAAQKSWCKDKMYERGGDGNCIKCHRTKKDHKTHYQGMFDLCYHDDWKKGYEGCCCNCVKDKGWSKYDELGCDQCKNKLRNGK